MAVRAIDVRVGLVLVVPFLAAAATADSLRNPEAFIVESAVPLVDGARELELGLAISYDGDASDIGPEAELVLAWGLDASEIELSLESDEHEGGLEIHYMRSIWREALSRPEVSFQVGAGSTGEYREGDGSTSIEAALLVRRGFRYGLLSTDWNVGWVESLDRLSEVAVPDGAFFAAGLSLPPGRTFHGIPSRRSSLDRRLFLMGRVRGFTDRDGERFWTPGLQVGARWTGGPLPRSYSAAVGWDRERDSVESPSTGVWSLRFTYVRGRGRSVQLPTRGGS